MPQSRRLFLQAVGAGMVIASLPEIPSIFSLCRFPVDKDEDLVATLQYLLLGRREGGSFSVRADTYVTEGKPQQLLDSPTALVHMLDSLGLDRNFTDRVSYCNASQCRQNFETQEAAWRKQSYDAFTNVKRAPADSNSAIMVGGIIKNNHLVSAEGATQYKQSPAVKLAYADPGVMVAAKWLLNESYTPSSKELTQGLTVVDKREVKTDSGETLTRYETPVSSIVYIPRPRRNSRLGQRAIGIVAAHNKNDQRNPDNISYADIYA